MRFIHANFLLTSPAAQRLYHEYAAPQPIIDFHNHLNPAEFATDKRWENIAQIWLHGDHYKWRAMRSNGVEEALCTGPAPDKERFFAFAKTMPHLLRNPLYHWCHLELARSFGIDDLLLSEDTAEEIWERTGAVLRGGFSAHQCLREANVELACTTDDPVSDLAHHRAAQANPALPTRLCPTFRPDKAHAIGAGRGYADYIAQLSAAAGQKIASYDDLLSALKSRHVFFHETGCRASDHGLETVPYVAERPRKMLNAIFQKALDDSAPISPQEAALFQSDILLECAAWNAAAGWVTQLHIGPLRNNNGALFARLGADTGFDSIGESNYAAALARHLDELSGRRLLGKTILYNIHPKDNEMLAAMLGNFQSAECPGKLQLGSGWWFLDNADGMRRQLEAISNQSLLSRFVGMLTDSRSFLSFSRHEYFRRVLCQLLGEEMERGILPHDFSLVGDLVSNISYHNAKRYFCV